MTRDQAEEIAEALYPIQPFRAMSDDYSISAYKENKTHQEAYMQCWEDMTALPHLKYMHAPSNLNQDHSL